MWIIIILEEDNSGNRWKIRYTSKVGLSKSFKILIEWNKYFFGHLCFLIVDSSISKSINKIINHIKIHLF